MDRMLCFHFTPPGNTRKPFVYYCFQGGVVNGNIGQKWVKARLMKKQMYDLLMLI